jgi:hydrogenase maturation protein HypF
MHEIEIMERRAILVRGIVQGIGFRPYLYNLATRLGLAGFVQNQTGTVRIEVEGKGEVLDRFIHELTVHPPALAQIKQLTWEPLPTRGERDFRIEISQADPGHEVFICPDVAVCTDCLRELFDPADRRFGYPFLNCTNCGPRLTIITGAPYDRPRTTMAGFPMCAACREEYDDPANRRFHAQPTACAMCGPSLGLVNPRGESISGDDPVSRFAHAVLAGKIGALKGLSGYHLVCDATNAEAVGELRRRKHRDEKPFAVMVADLAGAERSAHVLDPERELLRSPRCPIVLLRKRAPCLVAEPVAPCNPWLGVMLPYTPLHHLLLRAVEGRPLVMTSGNRSDEPIAYRDEEALEKLADIADLFLTHNRPIHVRCDDSLTRIVAGLELPIRRSRGYAPQPVELPVECKEPILAVGGQLKGTFALGRGRQAFLSHHLGDLDHYEAYRAFEKDILLYQELFDIRPRLLVYDLHPDYASTRYARKRAAEEGIRLLAVQHHHAHLAACMAEHGLNEPVIGVSFDGTGYGPDGAIWGGEFLIGNYQQFQRAAHFRYVGMPGGDQAIREPWRMALAHLLDAETGIGPLAARLSPRALPTIQTMLQRRLNTPWTSSVGRLFDAVAAIAGVRDRVSYEGQAAVELEWLATEAAPDAAYSFAVETVSGGPMIIDTRPLIRAAAEDVQKCMPSACIARRFHSTLVEIIVSACGQIRETSRLQTVTLSGGVFLNALLTQETSARLESHGFRVYRHRLVPPNDGGLSLGQLAIGASTIV